MRLGPPWLPAHVELIKTAGEWMVSGGFCTITRAQVLSRATKASPRVPCRGTTSGTHPETLYRCR
eukprot:134856-Chlamydomonas_euryale.AAC.2